MPRTPAVPHEALIASLLKTPGVLDDSGNVPGPSQAAWALVAEDLEGKVKPTYVYTYVRENRNDAYTRLCEARGVTPRTRDVHSSTAIPQKKGQSSDESDGELTTRSSHELSVRNLPRIVFNLTLDSSEWDKMKPVMRTFARKERPGNRTKLVLPPNSYQDILVQAAWDQHKLPCPFSFKEASVFSSPDAEQYVLFSFYCRECGTQGEGQIINEPEPNQPVNVKWRCHDTRGIAHTKKRFLKGSNRIAVSSQVTHSSVTTYRNAQARKMMNQGDVEPPTLFSTAVLRKAKQEQKDKELEVPHLADPVLSIQNMKHTTPYAGSIHDISLDKFFVHYYSPAQLLIYQMYAKKGRTVLSLDATGQVARRVMQCQTKSGHLFLFQGVINPSKGVTIPVVQMLSEKHDTSTIVYWLHEWQRRGAPAPDEVVIDNSPAFKSAIAKTFGQSIDIGHYKERCLRALHDKSLLPPCFLRLDVAHYINRAAQWKGWLEAGMKRLKDFYMRCLASNIKADSLDDFQHLLQCSLLASNSPYEGQEDSPVQQAVQFLTENIKGVEVPDEADLDDDDDEDDLDEENDNETSVSIENLLTGITDNNDTLMPATGEGRPNPYYAPKWHDKLLKMAKDFPLWSGVFVSAFRGTDLTASSAAVEGYFSDLKEHTLEASKVPLRVDKFVATHLQDIEGRCRIAGAALNRACNSQSRASEEEEGDEYFDDDTHPHDLSNTEDWRGLGSQETHKRSNTFYKGRKEAATEGTADSSAFDQIPAKGKKVIKNKEVKSTTSTDKETENVSSEEDAENGDRLHRWSNESIGHTSTRKKTIPAQKESGKQKTQTSKYLRPFPELQVTTQADIVKVPHRCLLINGNITGYVSVESSRIQIKNTCAFDSLAQIIANGYINYKKYQSAVDQSDSLTMRTAKELALRGALKSTYVLRCRSLTEVLSPSGTTGIPHPTTRGKRPSVFGLEYDCMTDPTELAEVLLGGDPSATVTVTCTNASCPNTCVKRVVVAEPHRDLLMTGLQNLKLAVEVALDLNNGASERACFEPCTDKQTVTVALQKHLLLNVDHFTGHEDAGIVKLFGVPLNTIPTQLTLQRDNFIILGIVHRSSANHVVAITRRAAGTWQMFDSLDKKEAFFKESSMVNPVILVYAKL